MIHVLHVITGLGTGGAETMLLRLLECSDRNRFRHSVVSLSTVDAVAARLHELAVDVSALDTRRRPLHALRALRAKVRHSRPDVIKSWMYHSDLAASLAHAHVPLVWGVHNATFGKGIRPSTKVVARVCAVMSHYVPRRIVTDSHAAVELHRRLRYDVSKFEVIPNGFDTNVFRPNAEARRRVREAIGVAPDTPLVGLVARFDPLKDHRTFLDAAAAVARERRDVHFVLCGGYGIEESNPSLMTLIEERALGGVVHLLGRTPDLPAAMAALDAGVSSSKSESFPLAIGELMACGVPCAVTDVGDSAFLVGDTGLVVRPEDPPALASAILTLLSGGAGRAEAARQRICDRFSLPQTVSRYEEVFETSARSRS